MEWLIYHIQLYHQTTESLLSIIFTNLANLTEAGKFASQLISTSVGELIIHCLPMHAHNKYRLLWNKWIVSTSKSSLWSYKGSLWRQSLTIIALELKKFIQNITNSKLLCGTTSTTNHGLKINLQASWKHFKYGYKFISNYNFHKLDTIQKNDVSF